jgi:uncharacterized protein YcbK (DUF882 family)
LSSSHAVRRIGLAAFLLMIGSMGPRDANGVGDTRTISLHHVHTNENLTITYKKNGQYDEEALKKINWILRDWRKNEAIKMDPQEIDLLWEVYQEVGAKEPINIICGYRAPDTNEMLRRRSRHSGVARFSQHTLGKAIDFFIPGVPLDKLRAASMLLQGGGVGYYPASGSPFVHVDVGNVRAWPRMTREQLVKLFPDGRTVHLPSDGNPLPGYQLALADVERNHRAAATPKKRSLIAALFGLPQDAEESEDNAAVRQDAIAARRTAPARAAAQAKPEPAAPPAARTVVASAAAPAPEPTPVPLPPIRPIYQIASAESRPAPAPAQRPAKPVNLAALSPNDIVNKRIPAEVALAYAAQTDGSGLMSRPAQIARPTGSATAAIVTRKANASVAIKPAETVPSSRLAKAGDRLNDPWLRGLMLTDSVQRSMIVTRFGDPDFTGLVRYMQKPDTAVAMTFSRDPHLGMSAEAFTGSAVVFQATVTFVERRTAALP